jgi:hypothetical protein
MSFMVPLAETIVQTEGDRYRPAIFSAADFWRSRIGEAFSLAQTIREFPLSKKDRGVLYRPIPDTPVFPHRLFTESFSVSIFATPLALPIVAGCQKKKRLRHEAQAALVCCCECVSVLLRKQDRRGCTLALVVFGLRNDPDLGAVRRVVR